MERTNYFLKICFITILFSIITEAKIYTKCEFAKALVRQGITNRSHLGTWGCIAYHESNFNTKAVNTKTGDYGILQINHYYWCSDTQTPGKGCNITCNSLLGDNITEDITCARKVYAETQRFSKNGFTAWTTYKTYCLGDQSKWINGCSL